MESAEKEKLLYSVLRNHLPVAPERDRQLISFLENPENEKMVTEIVRNANILVEKWKIQERKREVLESSLRIPNGTVGKTYETFFEPAALGLKDIAAYYWTGLEAAGLAYDRTEGKIKGQPLKSGDFPLEFHFKVVGEDTEAKFSRKTVTLTINPDPKTLWKNLPSDQDDPYSKPDDVTVFSSFGERSILVSSKRGRSHANSGAFREDDFAFGALYNGWSIVAVADGAGSAQYSRKGSSLACSALIDYFRNDEKKKLFAFDKLLESAGEGTEISKSVNLLVYNVLGEAVLFVHKTLTAFAGANEFPVKDLNATLAFALIKKYPKAYAVMTFGVGDCPIGLISKDFSTVSLMNMMDVGEYGGGTRFITMNEIFQNEKFASRFFFRMVKDFSYLVLMSDGIYDPKFVVENALTDVKKWTEFLEDIQGKNAEGSGVQLTKDNPAIEQQLSTWMDFWSPGNHDDRTLAIIF